MNMHGKSLKKQKGHQNSCDDHVSPYLCEELVAEIFQRLPPKFLLQCRCLSKFWCSRIASPEFIRSNTLRSTYTVQKFLIRQKVMKDPRDDFYFYSLHSEEQLPVSNRRGYMERTAVLWPLHGVCIAGTCNGIFCVTYNNKTRITLWNPSIRHQLTLPRVPFLKDLFGFDVGVPTVAVGIGFDSITDDHKIVVISCSAKRRQVFKSALVYSMKSSSTWTAIAPPLTWFREVMSTACFVNGVLHWAVKSDHRYLMTYDLSSNVFGWIDLPEPDWISHRLTIIKGSLAVISYNREGENWIWVRRMENDDASSWSLVVKLKPIRSEGLLYVVSELMNGDILFDTYSEGFKVYNSMTRTRSRLAKFRESVNVYAEMYVESLALLDIGTPCEGNQLSYLEWKKGNQESSKLRR